MTQERAILNNMGTDEPGEERGQERERGHSLNNMGTDRWERTGVPGRQAWGTGIGK